MTEPVRVSGLVDVPGPPAAGDVEAQVDAAANERVEGVDQGLHGRPFQVTVNPSAWNECGDPSKLSPGAIVRFYFESLVRGRVKIVGRVRKDERERLLVRDNGDTYVLVADFRQPNRAIIHLQFVPPENPGLSRRYVEDGIA